MTLRSQVLLGLSVAAAILAGCSRSATSAENTPGRAQVLAFDYWVAPANPDLIRKLDKRLASGALRLNDPKSWGLEGAALCHYQAQFDSNPRQQDPDTGLEEHTRAPRLNLFGDPRSSGFNYLLNAYQSRTSGPPCSSAEMTVQGIQIVSRPGFASEEWAPGDTATLVARPRMGSNYLGDPLEYSTELEGQPLWFETAVDESGRHGQPRGRFQFIATNKQGDRLIIVAGGNWVMNQGG